MEPFTLAALALVVGGTAFGGIASKKSAKANNAAIRESARVNQESVNKNTGQSRLAFAEETAYASRQAQSALGAARASIGFDSGNSTTQYLASAIAQAEGDQFIRTANQQNREEAFQIQKESIVAQAKGGIVNASLATAQGALGGAQTGMSIAGALQNLGQSFESSKTAEQQNSLFADQKTLTGLQIEGAQEQLTFQRDLNSWQRQNFGAAIEQRNALQRSPYAGRTWMDWMFNGGGYKNTNPILPYSGGR